MVRRIARQGVFVDPTTDRMLDEAERLAGFRFTLTQGSWSGSVSASAGTHAGTGVVDLRSRDLGDQDVRRAIVALRTVGFAAWNRTPSEGPWPEHIHAVAVDLPGLAPAAARQVAALRAGRNGLANGRADRHADLKLPVVTWRQYLDRKDDEVTKDDIRAIAEAVWKLDAIPHTLVGDPSKPVNPDNPTWNARNTLAQAERLTREASNRLDRVEDAVAALNRKLDVLLDRVKC